MSRQIELIVESARSNSVVGELKSIADQHRAELGFHVRQTFIDSIAKGQLFVARLGSGAVGYVRFNHRKDRATTLYEIVTIPTARGAGVGRQLVESLIKDCQAKGSRSIRLQCPVELPANGFYEKLGFERLGARSRPGRSRPLYEWQYTVLPARPIEFVASITAASQDIKNLILLWERDGQTLRPFDTCIITPLFTEPRSFEYVRYLNERWGVQVIFDSGGFFVQQGKIKYEELFTKLLDLYHQNDWATAYVLPDYVPTSRQTEMEVDERVYVTAAEGVKFFKRLTADLGKKSLGVIQGRHPNQLAHCLKSYAEAGIPRIGFGSFDTMGKNAEINIFNEEAIQRLAFIKSWITDAYRTCQIDRVPDLHLFGVSAPNVMQEFSHYLATSFDSSGWMRTAGYGNVYLPFQGRRNITHGGSAIRNGDGLSAKQFYATCEKTKHSCPFCKDFRRLQKDRFARMLHNAIVFREMTATVNEVAQSMII